MSYDKQGNIGLAEAIRYFVTKEYTVSIPLNDSQQYDLIIDKDGIISRVSVKTCKYITKLNSKTGKQYQITLFTKTAPDGQHIKRNCDGSKFDLLFILLSDGRKFLIPSSIVDGKSSLSINANENGRNKYLVYLV